MLQADTFLLKILIPNQTARKAVSKKTSPETTKPSTVSGHGHAFENLKGNASVGAAKVSSITSHHSAESG